MTLPPAVKHRILLLFSSLGVLKGTLTASTVPMTFPVKGHISALTAAAPESSRAA
jgi:hypothetical protein